MSRKTILAIAPFVLVGPAIASQGIDAGSGSEVVRARYLMGARLEIRAIADESSGAAAIESAFERVAALERAMTTYDAQGELAQVNARSVTSADEGRRVFVTTISEDLERAIATAIRMAQASDGKFDPTVARQVESMGVRGSGGEPFRVSHRPAGLAPDTKATWRGVAVDRAAGTLTLEPAGLVLDLSGIGKGIALDEAARELERRGVTRALLDFGGQILALDPPPGRTGWEVGIAHPRDRERVLAQLELDRRSVSISSNVAEGRGASENDPGHVVDPATGELAGGAAMAGILATDATVADALSTALLVGGDADEVASWSEGAEGFVLSFDELAIAGSSGARLSSGVAIATGAALAADPPASRGGGDEPDQDERVEELERKIDLLAEELEKIRTGGIADDAGRGWSPLREDGTRRRRGRFGLGVAASKVYEKEKGVSLAGYGEWVYQGFDETDDSGAPSGKKDEADFLRLVLYAGYRFNDKIVFNSEIEYEHASTGEEGEVSVEFATIDFLLDPRINVRTGLVLVPVGHVNELHEPPTFLGARRPDVERVVLPTTWRELGTGVFGDWGDFSYRAYLTSSLEGSEFSASSGLRGGRQDASKAIAEDLGATARLDYSGVPGLIFGVSTFHGGTGQGEEVAGSEVQGNVTTLDFHADFEWRGLEVRGLWAAVNVSDAEQLSVLAEDTIGSRIEGWYLQAGYDVFSETSISNHRLIPFVRIEEYDTQKSVAPSLLDTVTGANDREQITYGLSYLPIPNIAVKVDYQDIDNAAGSGVDQFNVGVGFFF